MIDYKLKQKVLQFDEETSILKLQKQWSRMNYCKVFLGSCPTDLDENYLNYVHDLYWNDYPELWNEAGKINKSTYERMRRLRRKIAWMISNFDCSFLTINFSDETLQLDSKYRRILIQRTCNALDTFYIGNIDFGSQDIYLDKYGCERLGTAREHYHVLVAKLVNSSEDSSLVSFCEKYGYVYVEYCRTSLADMHRLARYTAKLSNHALKETAQRSALLYSRKHQIPKDLPDIFLPNESALDSVIVDERDILRPCEDFDIYYQDSFCPEKVHYFSPKK